MDDPREAEGIGQATNKEKGAGPPEPVEEEEELAPRKGHGWAAFTLVSLFGGALIGSAILFVKPEQCCGATRSAHLEYKARDRAIEEAIQGGHAPESGREITPSQPMEGSPQ